MSIKSIYSMKVASIDMARPNRYEVEILPPASLDLSAEKDIRKISLNCNSAEIPGRILGLSDIRNAGGPIRRLPYDRIYNPVNVGFYADSELQEWNFFNSWMDLISEKKKTSNTKSTSEAVSDIFNSNPDTTENNTRYFEYYNNYIGQITIAQLNMVSLSTKLVTLIEAYPVNLSAVAYAYENGDAVQTFNVSFQFREYTVKDGIFSIANLTENLPGKFLDLVKSKF